MNTFVQAHNELYSLVTAHDQQLALVSAKYPHGYSNRSDPVIRELQQRQAAVAIFAKQHGYTEAQCYSLVRGH